ncbi:MAG: lipase family alpha/beta hydrolase [Pseudohongiellaceae bacterium]
MNTSQAADSRSRRTAPARRMPRALLLALPLVLLLTLLLVFLLFPQLLSQHSSTAATLAKPGTEQQVVVLLHGLGRLPGSMSRMAKQLEQEGYAVCNIKYPSRQHTINDLTDNFVVPAIRACVSETDSPPRFVTHSLGGIIVRQLAQAHPDIPIGRVVMLSPPNQGSELVDKLGNWYLFKLINGPAGTQLGTATDSVPNSLGPVTFELGVITGNGSTNPIYSKMIPGADDGKVAVTKARQDGMQDFLVLPYAHTFIAHKDEVIQQALHFLNNGEFRKP